MRHILTSILLILLGATLHGCGTSLPQEVELSFLTQANDDCTIFGTECENPKITKTRHLQPNEADKRNGVQDSWCIEFTQLVRGNRIGDQWRDQKGFMMGDKIDGEWRFYSTGGLFVMMLQKYVVDCRI